MRDPDLRHLGGGGGGSINAVSDEWLWHPPDEGPWAHYLAGAAGDAKRGREI